MTSTVNMRDAVLGAYNGPGWAAKVKRMTEAQVIAIYKRLQEQGKVS